MFDKIKISLTSDKIIEYVKIVLVILLLTIEIVICAQTYTKAEPFYMFYITVACCVVLLALEAVNTFVIKNFAAKMVLYGLDSALILTICILTGNSFMSTIYCIVLTQYYITLEKFRDKTILFGVSCGIFAFSFIIGCIINAPTTEPLDVIIGILFGFLVLALDYIVSMFLLKFYQTNIELSAALKQTEESRMRLREVYEELTQTKVYEERNRIAKDIHDTAGHSMTTVIMQTEAAKLLIDENPAEAKNRIISANIQARNALDQMRESVHLLAGRGKTKPLKDEIEEILAQTIDGTDIKARCDIASVHPSEDVYRFLTNSLKELLSNGIRHGKATAFYVELKREEGVIKLYVSDNGKGVHGDVGEGFGLRGIREKAEKLGGQCGFSSEDGEGFEAEITIPYQGSKENADD